MDSFQLEFAKPCPSLIIIGVNELLPMAHNFRIILVSYGRDAVFSGRIHPVQLLYYFYRLIPGT